MALITGAFYMPSYNGRLSSCGIATIGLAPYQITRGRDRDNKRRRTYERVFKRFRPRTGSNRQHHGGAWQVTYS